MERARSPASRAGRGVAVELLLRDLRHALRSLRRSPGFTFVATASLALGLGANVTVFGLANAVLFRSLPVERPSELVNIFSTERGAGSFLLSHVEYLDMRDIDDLFVDVAAHSFNEFAITIAGDPESVSGEFVSENYFSTLGVVPVQGRALGPAELGAMAADPVAVIGHRLWQREFSANSSAVGATIKINGHPTVVIGVAPPGFAGTFVGAESSVWILTSMYDGFMGGRESLNDRMARRFDVTARLAAGTTLSQAEAALTVLAERLERDHPVDQRDRGYLVARAQGVRPGMKAVATVFMSALLVIVGLVLLVSCTNVAGLLLVRGAERRRDVALRFALGASRARLIREALAESLVLAFAAGAAGLLIARWAASLADTFAPALGIPLRLDLTPDATVLAVTALVTLVTGLTFGMLPALQGTRRDLLSILPDTRTQGFRRSLTRNAVIVAQVSLSVVLLVASDLTVRSLRLAARAERGFPTDGLGIVSVDLDVLGYDETRGRNFYGDVVRRMGDLPGVESVALAHFVPLSSQSDQHDILVRRPDGGEQRIPRVYYNVIGEDYFATMGIPVLRGSDFTRRQTRGTRDVVVNEAMARQFWPDEDPVGQRFVLASETETPVEVIGVARDIKYRSVGEPPRPYMYFSFGSEYRGAMTLHVRARHPIESTLPLVVSELRGVEPDLPIAGIGPIANTTRFTLRIQQLLSAVLTVAGAVAILLATIGLYSVVAYSAQQRTYEMGIRLALGARPSDVTRLLLTQGLRLALLGVALGTIIALAVTRTLSSMFYGVSAGDVSTYLTIVVGVTAVSLLSSYLPARRVTRTDPTAALRST